MAEWQERGSVNIGQDIYFLTFGTVCGVMTSGAWFGSTFNCIALALNRVVEMIPAAHRFSVPRQDKSVYVWMVVCVVVMIGRPFFTRPFLYNSAVAAYLAAPVISDDTSWLFLQALVICASTAIAAISYVFVEFVPVPRAVVILANVTWQLSHGMHRIVYICLNKFIRTEVGDLLRCKKRSKSIHTSTLTITVVKGSGH
ncbi:hypothetical protein ANCDUO_02676 [Ancylostoma duodenale]|uniref:7TM GPCR serpentine receptor class x (Srx) domain-containing protein n=1 Tax=Ancylostoma duodenale TaxID=51022 RepID=A0A0C2DVU2_9BILA|nr:hypothetical protein ANCDUO_02676 [Ancylostoma duodenale]